MFEAILYNRVGKKVVCGLCPHNCFIPDGKRGKCRVRKNIGGRLYSLNYGKLIAQNIDPIEKKPLYHFLPGSKSYSIATAGCNLRCMHCQNHEISQVLDDRMLQVDGVSPQSIVDAALAGGCKSIAYTYTEPTVFLEYALDIAKLAKKSGLKNVFVSNGFISDDALDMFMPYLDADNIDLKSFSDGFYQKICGARLEPVLNTLRRLVEEDVWVEVTTLIIPGLNDSKVELSKIANFIFDDLGENVPWHVSRFHPDYNMAATQPTDEKMIISTVELGREIGLKNVYGGNVNVSGVGDTYCSKCGSLLIKRVGYDITFNGVSSGYCPKCKKKCLGVYS